MKSNARNTKGRIISAAWKLFYEQGYDDTTIEDIVSLSETSKGSFYHYFEGKDDLMNSLSYVFDEKYGEIMDEIDCDMNSFDKLMYINKVLFEMIENSISLDLLTRLYSSQLVTKGNRSLLDHNRAYYKVLRSIVKDGQNKGEISDDFTVSEIVKAYALCERGILYDWCLCGGEYSLRDYSVKHMPMLMKSYKK